MACYEYQGLTEQQKQAFIDSNMAPLMDDDQPHPRFGGFPDPTGANPHEFYPRDKDKPKTLKLKAEKRDKYRELRRRELEAQAEEMDKQRTIGGMIFPKGVPIEMPDNHPMLHPRVFRSGNAVTKKPPKMDNLVKSGTFKKCKGPGKSPEKPKVVSKALSPLAQLEKEMGLADPVEMEKVDIPTPPPPVVMEEEDTPKPRGRSKKE